MVNKVEYIMWHNSELLIYCEQKHVCIVTIYTESINQSVYRVQQKSGPLKFFAVFSATVSNFNLKFYRLIYWNVLHLTAT